MKYMHAIHSSMRSLGLLFGLLLLSSSSAVAVEDPHQHGAPSAAPAAGTASKIREFKVPTPFSFPYGLIIDGQGRVWFSEQAGNRIGMYDPAKDAIEEFLLPSAKAVDEKARGTKSFSVSEIGSPTAMALAGDGSIWFVQRYGNSLGRLDPSTKEIVEMPVPTPQSAPHGLAVAKDGTVWFTERNANKIGSYNPASKRFKEFTIPGKNRQPAGIALDPSGNVWYAEADGNAIAKLDPATAMIKTYPLMTPFATPSEIAVDAKGNVWFTQLNANALGMIRAEGGVIDDAQIPTYASVPMGLALDPAGRVWFTETRGNKIGFFDPAIPLFKEFDIPTTHSLPTSIALDAKGNVWFTENDRDANKLAMLPASEVAASLSAADTGKTATPPPAMGRPVWLYVALGGFGVAVLLLLVYLRVGARGKGAAH